METKKRRRSPGSSGEEDTFSLSGDISSSTEDASSDLSGAGAARASKTSPTCLQLDASLLRKARRIETEARRVSLSVKDFALVSPSRGDGSPDGADAAEGVKRQLRLWQRLVALRVKMETALQRVRLLPEAPLLRRLEKNVDASDVNHKLLVQSLLGSTGGGGCLGEVSASPGSSSSSSFSVESAKVRAAALFAQLRLLQTRLLLCSSLADDSSKSGLPAFDFEIEERQGAEAAVWNCVGDGLFSQGLRSLLLRILDDWNRSVCSSVSRKANRVIGFYRQTPRRGASLTWGGRRPRLVGWAAQTAGKFASLSQNLSSQVQGAMKAEREKLLSRHLKTAHVPVDGKCAVLGCLDSSAPPPKSHATYDDGVSLFLSF